jgi:hypothetical protein
MSTEKDAIDAPQEDQTIGDAYPESFEESSSDVFVAEGAEPIEDPDAEEPAEGEPEGDEPEGEPEETPETDELAPLEEEEVEEPEDKPDQTVPLHVLQRERKRRQAAEAQLREPVSPPGGDISHQSGPVYAPQGEPPKESDFEDERDFLVAKAVYEADEKRKRDEAANRERQQIEAQKAAQYKLQANYESRIDDHLAQKPEDTQVFEEAEQFVVSLGLNGMAFRSLMTADLPVSIMKYLLKHPAEAMKIAKMDPLQQVEEIGHLKKRSTVKPRSKKVTKASEPVAVERGDSSPPKPTKFSQDMSEKEYDKLKASKGDSLTVGDLTG